MHQAQEATRNENIQARAAHFGNMEDIARNAAATNAAKVENANNIGMAKNALAATKLFNDSEDAQMRAQYAKQYSKDWMNNPEARRNYTIEKNMRIGQLARSGGLEDNTGAPNSSSL
jgi:capsid protein